MVVPASSALTVIPKKSSAITAESGGAMSVFKPPKKEKKKTVNKRSFFSNNKFDFSNAFSPKFGGINFDFSRSKVEANERVLSAIEETNAILQDIGNALAVDFANRVAEGRSKIKASKSALLKSRYTAKESALESSRKVGSFIKDSAKKVLDVTGLGGLFKKIWKFFKFILIGIAGTSLIKWIQGGGIGKLKNGFAGIWEGIKNFLGPIWDQTKKGLSWVGEKLKPIWKPIWNVLKFAGQQITKALRALTAFVIQLKPLAVIPRATGGLADALTFDLFDFDKKNPKGSPKIENIGDFGKRTLGGIADFFTLGYTDFDKRGASVGQLGTVNWNKNSAVEPSVTPDKNLVSKDQSSVTFLNMPDKVDTSLLKKEEPSSGSLTGIVPIDSVNRMNPYMESVPDILGIVGVGM